MLRRLAPLVVAGLSLIATSARAAADTVASSRDAGLYLDDAQWTARHDGGLVHLTVRYDVVNPSRHPDDATLDLTVPARAVVTGLRYRMSPGSPWLDGSLLAAATAEARFAAFADASFVAARGPALLSHDGLRAALALSYVPAHGRVTVEYQLATPACFARGHWIVTAPDHDQDHDPDRAPPPRARARVTAGRQLSTAAVTALLGGPPDELCAAFTGPDGDPLLTGADDYLVFADPRRGLTSAVTTIAAGATTVTTLDLLAGDPLVPAPRAAAVVFVVDASRSIGDDGVTAQLAVIRAYLAHLPDARADIVVVRRRATRLFGAFVPAAEAARRLSLLPPQALALGNGSQLDTGLALAANLLASTAGPHRLVAFTDDRLRTALDEPAVTAALADAPADTIVHLAIPRFAADADSTVDRDFEHRFVAPITATGGIVAYLQVGADPAPFLELVRPLRLDGLQLIQPHPDAGTQPDRTPTVEELPALTAGTGLRRIVVGPAPTVTGWLWGQRWQPSPVQTRVATTRAARLVLGERDGSLEDDAVIALAALGHTASRLTSFLAVDPRWRAGGLPADENFGRSGTGFGATCGCGYAPGLGRFGTIGHGSGTGTAQPVPTLAPLLEARVAACAATTTAPWSATVAVETTGIEIVDVTVTTSGPDLAADARDRLTACITDAAWDLTLDARFARYTSTFTASF